MRKIVISGMIGNGLEWYDYALYGQMALLIGHLFFPPGDAATQLLATYGVFAAGFIVRPVGAALFGWIGDHYGRKRSLIIAVLMMAIPTGCIGLMPTYEQIGIWAPIGLTFIRLLQGLSLGGEFSGSITYLVEHAPGGKRGRVGSACIISLILGFLLGSLVTAAFSSLLSKEDFESWGWRLPFLFGIFIGFIGFYIRTHCEESPAYTKAKESGQLSARPVREVFATQLRPMLRGFAMYFSVTMPFYLVAIYFIGFSQRDLGLTTSQAMMLNVINMLVMMAANFFSARLSDRVGRKPVMIAAASAMAVLAIPLFAAFEGANLTQIILIQTAFALVLGVYTGPVAAVLVELFPTSVRYTGMAISYNLSAALIGGTTPMVCTWLLAQFHTPVSIAAYMIFCNIVSLLALARYHDRWKDVLP